LPKFTKIIKESGPSSVTLRLLLSLPWNARPASPAPLPYVLLTKAPLAQEVLNFKHTSFNNVTSFLFQFYMLILSTNYM
jgi:hypothetical protein